MSTRSKTKAAAAVSAASAAPKSPLSKSQKIPTTTTKDLAPRKQQAPPAKPPPAKKSRKSNGDKVFCTCKKGDDGTPMVYCVECKDWYHFSCVNLSERDAEDINIYVCPNCTETTGLRSVMLWEGPDAVEEVSRPAQLPEKTIGPKVLVVPDDPEDSDSQNGNTSEEEEYVATTKRRSTRQLNYSSDSDSSASSSTSIRTGRIRRAGQKDSSSKRNLKRKPQTGTGTEPASKKKKKVSDDAMEDPTRKYCLGKLEDVFRDIFFRYPHPGDEDEKLAGEMTEEERSTILERSKQFAADLEHSIYETYSEFDKLGNPSAAGKYKDRFRMLQFNLSKVDRVVLHKRIASAQISAKEISLMSSTDLANEETKKHIKVAEQEALEHSILQKTIAPRAKITHKGLEDIEDMNGESEAQVRQREAEEKEKRMESERQARLKAAQAQQPRARTMSVSVPPDSPITPTTVTASGWASALPPPLPPTPISKTTAEAMTLEPELNLADLINIDDEPASAGAEPSPIITSPTVELPMEEPVNEPAVSPPMPASSPSVGISPFAANAEFSRKASFDLDSLWSAPRPPASSTDVEMKPPIVDTSPPPPANNVNISVAAMMTSEPDDRDFDMLLEEKETPTPEALQAAFDAMPHVWSGKINMPLDSSIPQETPVIARQMGGRTLGAESILWKTLLPSDLLRIDGRVPVENSAKFLLQIRMNPMKELIAVAFSPASSSKDTPFRILSDFLIAKGRHGLVFPWGHRPKDYHPGKELYIIPLLSSNPLPDYMELLDELKLPKIRQSNYLIGIWVLNKGKLAPLPHPVAPPPVAQPPKMPATPIGSIPLSSAPPIPAVLAPKEPSSLAAEVAQLTPEQIQDMLRSLSNAAPIAAPVIPPPHIMPGPPPHWGHPPPIHGPGPYNNPQHPMYPPHAPGFPPPPPNYGMGPPPNFHHGGPPLPPHQPPFHEGPYRGDNGPDQWRDGRGDSRGWKGNRGKGKGRGRNGPQDVPSGPVDSGWPRRK